MNDKPDDILTIDELSAYLKIPKSTLYKVVREGKVPCQKIGRHWRFRKEAIDRWLEDPPAAPHAAQSGTGRSGDVPAQAGTHDDTTNRQESRLACTEGAPEGREPGKARVEDGGNE